MASWSVFEPPGTAPKSFEAADKSAFVKEGWCWPALLIAPVWLLWRRMWLVFLGWLAVMVAISVVSALVRAPEAFAGALQLLFTLWFALEANALRRWTLLGKGWRFAGIATGSDRVEAEYRFFERRGESSAPAPVPPPAASAALRDRDETVLGVFPSPWDGRR